MDKNIQIRPLSFNDIDNVILFKKNIIGRPEFDINVEKTIYDWELKRNPYRRDDFPFGFVLESAGKIVGSVVLIPARFKLGNNTIYGCYEVDLFVLPEYRFHGLKLLNKVWKEKIFPVVISTTPNSLSFELERNLGAIPISFSGCKYLKVITVPPICKSKYHILKLANAVTLLLGSKRKRGSLNINIEEIAKFDERFDKLFQSISMDYKLMHIRDSVYLNWRYIDFPLGKRRIFSIFDNKNNLKGFVVMQLENESKRVKKINVLELFTKKDDEVSLISLLDYLTNIAKEEGAHLMQIVPMNMVVDTIFKKCGFIKRKLKFPSCLLKAYPITAAKPQNTFDEIVDCYISSGDGDSSIYSSVFLQ